MIRVIFLFLLLTSVILGNAQEAEKNDSSNVSEEWTLKEKWQCATNKYKVSWMGSQDYQSALRIFRELVKNHPEDLSVNYYIARCYFHLNKFDEAKKHYDKAYKLDSTYRKDMLLMRGRVYKNIGEYQTAIQLLNQYKTTLTPKKLEGPEGKEINKYIDQCLFIKNQLANPIDVEIKNMGANINSEFSDTRPSLTADGLTMVFTSRRAESEGGTLCADGQYFEDVYMSVWNDTTKSWTKAEAIAGAVNTVNHDASLSISPDGTQLFLYKDVKGGDIFVANKKFSGRWTEPEPIDKIMEKKYINSSYFDSDAALANNGQELFFVSNREIKLFTNIGEGESYGLGDIWRSIKKPDGTWTKPQNLGDSINTEHDEIGVFVHPDGKTMFFSSKGHTGMGEYDIFMSIYNENTKTWSKPINLGYPINSKNNDLFFVVSTDYSKGYFCSEREDSYGFYDIYEVNLKGYFKKLQKEFNINLPANITDKNDKAKTSIAIIKGKVIDGESGTGLKSNIQVLDFLSQESITNIISEVNGQYFLTLESGKKYEFVITAEGYEESRIAIEMPKAETGTPTKVKHFVLEKSK